MTNRVVLTGLGIVSPLGLGVQKNWGKLLAKESGIRCTDILGDEYKKLPSRIAGIVDDYSIDCDIKKSWTPLPKYIKFGLIAAKEAIEDAKLSPEHMQLAGVSIGSGMAPLDLIGDAYEVLKGKGVRKVSPHLIPRLLPNMVGGHVSIEWGLQGPLLCSSTACATGLHSIGEAFRWIKHGYAARMIAGASEAGVGLLSIAGFSQARALSTSFNDTPSRASRPFSKSRDGFVLGEGAGVLVLESLSEATKRGAPIYAEIVGYGCSGDAYHITSSHPDGSGAFLAMNQSLAEASIDPKEVQHINAHATSTPIGDLAEATAMSKMFPESTNLSITANKSAIGHLLGAAGAVETIITAMTLHNSIIPPTLNYNADDPNVGPLNIPTEAKEDSQLRVALCNSFGFGGVNASLCLKKIIS